MFRESNNGESSEKVKREMWQDVASLFSKLKKSTLKKNLKALLDTLFFFFLRTDPWFIGPFPHGRW